MPKDPTEVVIKKRKSLSKKLRFEIFKRDGFRCSYCGKTPPEVTLEVDHIIPFSKGGECLLDNLTTSCFDCNRGKKNIKLSTLPNSISENVEILKEQELQLKEFRKILAIRRKRVNSEITEINNMYTKHFPEYTLSETFKNSSLKTFLKKIPKDEIVDAMEMACLKIHHRDKAVKYFCGICWNVIRRGGETW